MLTLDDVCFKYGDKPILKGIDAKFESGKFYGIIGVNGAGKSTLMELISGQIKPSRGQILWQGKPINKMTSRERAQKIAYMRQANPIRFPYTVRELVGMGRFCQEQSSREEDMERVIQSLKACDLWSYRDKPITDLSGGEIQRVYFAKTLVQGSDVLLIDEGVSNADIYFKLHFFEQLSEEAKRGKIVISIIHDLFLARKFCDELILLDQQRIFSRGKSNEVLNRASLKQVFKVHGDFQEHALILD